MTDSDSVAVVGDLDEFKAAILDEEIDGGGARVEAVLEELLDGGDRTLNDLAGGDSVDDGVTQALDFGRLHAGQGFALKLSVFHAFTHHFNSMCSICVASLARVSHTHLIN